MGSGMAHNSTWALACGLRCFMDTHGHGAFCERKSFENSLKDSFSLISLLCFPDID